MSKPEETKEPKARDDGTTSLVAAFRDAGRGLGLAVRRERNLRIHLVIACLVTGVARFVSVTLLEAAVLSLTIGFVIVSEILNSALERTLDRISPDYHPATRDAKDIAAGAVLVSAFVAVVTGLLILGPKLINLL